MAEPQVSISTLQRVQCRIGDFELSWNIPEGYTHRDSEGFFACSKFADGMDLPPRFAKHKREVVNKMWRRYFFEFESPFLGLWICSPWEKKKIIIQMDIAKTKLKGNFYTKKELQSKVRDHLYYYRGEMEKFLCQIAEAW